MSAAEGIDKPKADGGKTGVDPHNDHVENSFFRPCCLNTLLYRILRHLSIPIFGNRGLCGTFVPVDAHEAVCGRLTQFADRPEYVLDETF